MRTSTLFDAKNSGFFEIYGVSARTRKEGGRTSAEIFRTKERRHCFAILCWRRLWTAPVELLLSFTKDYVRSVTY